MKNTNPIADFFARNQVPIVHTKIGFELLKEFVAQLKATIPEATPDQIGVYLVPLNRTSHDPWSAEAIKEVLATPAKKRDKPPPKPKPSRFANPLFGDDL